jgi:hypothetical protein
MEKRISEHSIISVSGYRLKRAGVSKTNLRLLSKIKKLTSEKITLLKMAMIFVPYGVFPFGDSYRSN